MIHAEFNADGSRLLTFAVDLTGESSDGKHWLRDGRDGAPVCEPFGGVSAGFNSTFNADGTRLLTLAHARVGQLRDASTGMPLGSPLEHRNYVSAAVFSPDGTRLITLTGHSSGSADDFNEARLWDANTGAAIGEPMRPNTIGNRLAFDPDGKCVVIWADGIDKSSDMTLWDGRTGAMRGAMHHDGPVTRVAFSPDATRLLSGSEDHTARIWEATSGAALGEPMRHDGVVRDVAFSSDGASILTGSADGTARLWDGRTGAALMGAQIPEPQTAGVVGGGPKRQVGCCGRYSPIGRSRQARGRRLPPVATQHKRCPEGRT